MIQCGVCMDACDEGPYEDIYNEHDLSVGTWGGRCMCPSGNIFQVGVKLDYDGIVRDLDGKMVGKRFQDQDGMVRRKTPRDEIAFTGELLASNTTIDDAGVVTFHHGFLGKIDGQSEQKVGYSPGDHVVVGAEGEIVGKRMKDGNVYAAGPQRFTGRIVANTTEMTPDGVVKGVLNGAAVPSFSLETVIIGRIEPSEDTMACEGGVSDMFMEHGGPWSGKSVVCHQCPWGNEPPSPPTYLPPPPPPLLSPPEWDCSDDLLFDLAGSSVSHNNLGGVGPDKGAENIRYAGVGSLNGRAFDLLVEVVDGYAYAVYGGVGGVGGTGGAGGIGGVDIEPADVTVTAVQNADGTWSVNVKLDAEGCCGAPERDAAAAQSVTDQLKAMKPAGLATVLGMSGIKAADVTVSAVQNADGTWSVSVELDAEECCGAPERDAAAAQSAANRLTAMTPAELATVLDMSGSTLSSVISTTPAVVVDGVGGAAGAAGGVGGAPGTTAAVVSFGFVVDAGSYEPATSPASYAADLAEEVGSAVISVKPATVALPSSLVVSLSFIVDGNIAGSYEPDTSPASYAAALATEMSVDVEAIDGVDVGGVEVGTGGVVGGTGVGGAAGYSAPNGAADNGRVGRFATINMAFGSRTRLRFTFIWSDSKSAKVAPQP